MGRKENPLLILEKPIPNSKGNDILQGCVKRCIVGVVFCHHLEGHMITVWVKVKGRPKGKN